MSERREAVGRAPACGGDMLRRAARNCGGERTEERRETMQIENILPRDIEKRSFEIITAELAEKGIAIDERYAHIIKRCIHTSADFDYARTLYFSDGAAEAAEQALKSGCTIITDTRMAQSGINKTRLTEWGTDVQCFISDPDVAAGAAERGVTRSYVSMEKALEMDKPVIFAVGNAPTALISIVDLKEKYGFAPAAVIGVPVGFVNVEASKELLIASGIPCIVNKGRKGGSNIAACIINAIQYGPKR